MEKLKKLAIKAKEKAKAWVKSFKQKPPKQRWGIVFLTLWASIAIYSGVKTVYDIRAMQESMDAAMVSTTSTASKMFIKNKSVDPFKDTMTSTDMMTNELLSRMNWSSLEKKIIGFEDLNRIKADQVSKKFGVWLTEGDREYKALVFLEDGDQAKRVFVVNDMTYSQYLELSRFYGENVKNLVMQATSVTGASESVAAAPKVQTLYDALTLKAVPMFQTQWKNIYNPDPITQKEVREMTMFDRLWSMVGSVLLFIVSNIFTIIMVFFLFLIIKPMLMASKKFEVIQPKDNKSNLNSLIGMEDVKKELEVVGNVLKDQDKYAEYGIERPLNIAFSGPPGTGKTKAAGALARDLGLPLITIPAANLETGYVAGGANTLKTLHAAAKRLAPCIVFIDEAQTLFKKRGTSRESWADDTANSFLSILDGVPKKGEKPIIWIVASNFDNHNMRQDEAMARRFPLQVNFRLPNRDERKAILKSYLEKKAIGLWNEESVDFDYLAEVTANLSPANLENIVENASMTAINDQNQKNRLRLPHIMGDKEHKEESVQITTEAVFKAFERLTVGLTDRATTKDKETQRRRIAIHESGHFVQGLETTRYELMREGKLVTWKNMEENTTMLKISTEAISKMNALGYVLHRQDDVGLKGRKSLEYDIKGLYGGLAAEEVFYGQDDISIGAHNDIEKVSVILTRMIVELGMYSNVHINTFRVNNPHGQMEVSSKVTDEDMQAVRDKASQLYEETVASVEKYRGLIELFTDRLMSDYVINIEQAFAILKEHPELLPFTVEEEPIEESVDIVSEA